MLTAGVDLAAEPKKTALALVEWTSRGAILLDLQLNADNAQIVDACSDAEAVGVDCPFGWPEEFIAFVLAHSKHEQDPRDLAGASWRRRLAYRDTDRFVRERTGRWPLSVSTDRLGLTAMRCSELLAEFAGRGEFIDRAGSGRIIEVYPGAAIRTWGIDAQGYKTDVDARGVATRNLLIAAPWLQADDAHIALMSRSDDAFDALIAALISRAHALGHTESPPDVSLERASSEGWIRLPTIELRDLISD